MCELFGVSGHKSIKVNDYLKEFFSHSKDHPDGWGMAVFYGDAVSLEKEPITAKNSVYLKERLKHPFQVKNMMAHIRLATRGVLSYENCHPFVKRDCTDRAWTLMHNGTIFHCTELEKFVHEQEGLTDSERIICYIIEQINMATEKKGEPLNKKERFEVIDHLIQVITPNNNKVNLLIYDGELYYVHTNFKNTLYQKKQDSSMIFSTVPLDDDEWRPVSFMQLEAYENGEFVYSGTKHNFEYFLKEEDMKYIFLDYSGL